MPREPNRPLDVDGKIYVVGSAAGRDASPAWVFNLRADPTLTVEIGPDPPTQMVAHELPKTERDNVYERASSNSHPASASTRSGPTASSPSSS